MSEAKNKNLGFNYCSCGNYLYSINEIRSKVTRNNQVTIFHKSNEIEIRCSNCGKITKLKIGQCMV